MTDRLLDECYSCVIASLILIKSLASDQNHSVSNVIELAADLSQTCIASIRSHEAGSVLPETVDRLADEGQRLIDAMDTASIRSTESAACSVACENFIRTYHQVA